MATLTNNSFRYIQAWVNSQPAIKADFKTWSLSRPTLQAAFQALEDYMVNGFSVRPATSIRAAIEAVTGATTAARAQSFFAAWVAWKLNTFLGGG